MGMKVLATAAVFAVLAQRHPYWRPQRCMRIDRVLLEDRLEEHSVVVLELPFSSADNDVPGSYGNSTISAAYGVVIHGLYLSLRVVVTKNYWEASGNTKALVGVIIQRPVPEFQATIKEIIMDGVSGEFPFELLNNNNYPSPNATDHTSYVFAKVELREGVVSSGRVFLAFLTDQLQIPAIFPPPNKPNQTPITNVFLQQLHGEGGIGQVEIRCRHERRLYGSTAILASISPFFNTQLSNNAMIVNMTSYSLETVEQLLKGICLGHFDDLQIFTTKHLALVLRLEEELEYADTGMTLTMKEALVMFLNMGDRYGYRVLADRVLVTLSELPPQQLQTFQDNLALMGNQKARLRSMMAARQRLDVPPCLLSL